MALPAAGQVRVGDDLNLNLNGVLASGYSGIYGDQIASSHGLNVSGNGTLSGSYYNPNFISFNLSPYYGQARQSADSLSLFNSGGLDFSSTIFGGSHFPGSIGFSKNWDSQGTFGIPGVANYTTRGSGQGFNIGWGAFFPDYPSLSATFSDGSSDYSVLGSPLRGNNQVRSFTLHSGYTIAGFNLGANYNLGVSHAATPDVFGTQTIEKASSDTNSLSFSASHQLPMRGSFSTSFSRAYMNSDYFGSSYHGTLDNLNGNVGFHPTQKLSFSVSSGYADNLTGTLLQTILSGNGTSTQSGTQAGTNGGIFESNNQKSNSFYVAAVADYTIFKSAQLELEAQRRQQTFMGSTFSANLYGGGLSYRHPLFGGYVASSVSFADSNSDATRGNSLSFSTSLTYSRTIQLWAVSGDASYSQNVQTFLITYMNSFYNYSGSLRRRFFDGRLIWGATAAGSHSALTNQPHTGNGGHSYSTTLGIHHFTTAASYSESSGYGLLGLNGMIQPTAPPPGTVPADWLILYGGHSYTFSMGTTPARKLSFGANFSRAWSNTNSGGVNSWNHVEQANALLNYQFRKLTFTSGYGRLLQGFSASGTPPSNVNSFYAGLSRSFNFF